MGDRTATRKPRGFSMRISYRNRLYIDRTARIRGISRADLVEEMINEHRDRTVAALKSVGIQNDEREAA